MALTERKICTKCKLELDFSSFGNKKGGKFGLRAICKKCASIEKRDYSKINREKERERHRLLYKANPEKSKERCRKWREANPKKVKEAARKWREANPKIKDEHIRIKKEAEKLLMLLKNYSDPLRFSEYEINAVQQIIDYADRNIKQSTHF
jgi:hypothetical protein